MARDDAADGQHRRQELHAVQHVVDAAGMVGLPGSEFRRLKYFGSVHYWSGAQDRVRLRRCRHFNYFISSRQQALYGCRTDESIFPHDQNAGGCLGPTKP
jgi:hypothetical protein